MQDKLIMSMISLKHTGKILIDKIRWIPRSITSRSLAKESEYARKPVAVAAKSL